MKKLRWMTGVQVVAILVTTIAETDPLFAQTELKDSEPVVASFSGEIIEGLRIYATDEPAILVKNLSNVIIRNVEIFHEGNHGILCANAPGLIIQSVSITHIGSDISNARENNINCKSSDGVKITNARLRGGSSGIYILKSAHARLKFIEGYDFRGPFPRGQLVQFNKSPNCVLEDFSAINDPLISWVEDNVSIFRSNNCVVRRGLLDGNNSRSGVGVMFESSTDGLVEDVDTLRQGNGSFSAYPGHDITFRRTRARDNLCGDQGRGAPSSNGLIWAGRTKSSGLRVENSTYFNACNPRNIVWSRKVFDIIEIVKENFAPRGQIHNKFCWEVDCE